MLDTRTLIRQNSKVSFVNFFTYLARMYAGVRMLTTSLMANRARAAELLMKVLAAPLIERFKVRLFKHSWQSQI